MRAGRELGDGRVERDPGEQRPQALGIRFLGLGEPGGAWPQPDEPLLRMRNVFLALAVADRVLEIAQRAR